MSGSRPLSEQFASLPPEIQSRLFRVLDVLIGASQSEKDTIRTVATAMAKQPPPPGAEPLPALFDALASLAMWAHVAAEPKGE